MNCNVIILVIVIITLSFMDLAASKSLTNATEEDEVFIIESRSKRGASSRTKACPIHTTEHFMQSRSRMINDKIKASKAFGSQGSIHEHRDINEIDCCELRRKMIHSQCSVLAKSNFMSKELTKILLVVIELMKNNLEYRAEVGSKRSTRGGTKRERKQKRRLLHADLVRKIRATCVAVELDENLTPRSYTQYFVGRFRGCNACQSSGKCAE